MSARSQAQLLEMLRRPGETIDQTLTRVLETALDLKLLLEWLGQHHRRATLGPSASGFELGLFCRSFEQSLRTAADASGYGFRYWRRDCFESALAAGAGATLTGPDSTLDPGAETK